MNTCIYFFIHFSFFYLLTLLTLLTILTIARKVSYKTDITKSSKLHLTYCTITRKLLVFGVSFSLSVFFILFLILQFFFITTNE